MVLNWYPEKLRVGPNGTQSTYQFIESVFGKERHFVYAEFGIYEANTAKNICERFPNSVLHLFDYHHQIEKARAKLSVFENKIYYYGNTPNYNDSYNWSLAKLISKNQNSEIFDYCFLDGAHTFAIDALTFFLCDRLTKPGGFIDFDDYSWTLRGSSMDPSHVPEIRQQYTDEQIDTQQVRMIVDLLVKPNKRYRTVVENKIYQKLE